MRKQFLGSCLGLLAGAGLAWAQPDAAMPQAVPAGSGMLPAVVQPTGHHGKTEHGEEIVEVAPGSDCAACPSPAQYGISVEDGPNAFWEAAPQNAEEYQNYLPRKHYWGSIEFPLMWVNNAPLPGALLTTGPAAGGGIPGTPGTASVLGSNVDYGSIPALRGAFGVTSPDQTCGLEVIGLLLETTSTNSSFASGPAGLPLLARPFVDAQTFMGTAALVASPGQFSGTFNFGSTLRLWTTEANVTWQRGSVDMLVGFRYASLDESLALGQTTSILPGGVAGFNGNLITAPNRLMLLDAFDSRNQFYGGQIGVQKESRWGKMFIFMSGKCGFGNNHQTAKTNGSTTLSTPAGVVGTVPGGLLAVRSNIGVRSRDEFSILPELAVNVGVDLTCWFRVYAGYNAVYWTNVLRPGDQISRGVNPGFVPSSVNFGTGVPSLNVPQPRFGNSDFWAQGVTFGMAVRY